MSKGRSGGAAAAGRKLSVEWPTVALAAALYAAFGLLTWHYAALPWWLVLPLGAYLVCLQGSLQHEAVHGHPTPWPWLNELLVLPNLWLWMPYRLYRESHLRHHSDEILTDPLNDPESYYQTPEAWARRDPLGRALAWTLNTLLGRLLLGPPVCVWRLLREAPGNLARGGREQAAAWLVHLVSVALVLAWVLAVCDIPLAAYLALFAYPGLSLTLLRSFLEHQAREPVGERSVLIEAGPVMSLLFLNNNLHALHHAEPGLAWHRLPARYRMRRGELLEANGGYRYDGYGEVFRRYLLRPKEPPAHPFLGVPVEVPAEAPVRAGQ
ncbi:MAG: fatty acid desaturase [Rhodospirillales bacterium]|nr:fatty acid desaturase [Rhodospirillales bacterium]